MKNSWSEFSSMRLDLAPPTLVILGVAAAAIPFALVPDGQSVAATATFVAGLVAYFVGSDWWLTRLGAAPIAEGRRARRIAGILALAAPSAIWGVGVFAIIVTEGDNAWMVLPYAIAPVLFVWPFAISALRKVRGSRPGDHQPDR